jgi:WD40 repeat protein
MNETALPQSPYKGLMPYSEEDEPFFFGRDSEREIITANLRASRLTLLYGASGVGKTSVLRAGVVYHLQELVQRNLAKWGKPRFAVVLFDSWRDSPVAGLADKVQESVARALNVKTLEPVPPSRALARILQTCAEQVDGNLFIALDQFEEYFLYHAQEDGEGTFAIEFPRVVNCPDLRVNFLVSIREDSLAKLDRFKGRIPSLFDNYLRIEHLNREAGWAAIKEPIQKYVELYGAEGHPVDVEDALVEAVLDQVKTAQVVLGEAGRGIVERERAKAQIETSYLQLVMTRLWDEEMRVGSRVLRLETLNRLGEAKRIVGTYLDTAMSTMPSNEQDIAARVFRFLATPDGTKIALSVCDLEAFAGLPHAQLIPVLDKLSRPAVRILRPVAPPPDQPTAPRFEIFHDVLAPAILDWRARHVQTQERTEAKKQLARERGRVAWLGLGLVWMLSLLIATVALMVFAFEQRNAAEQARNAAEQAYAIVNLLDRSVPNFKAIMRGHTKPVSSAEFSPDGRFVVTASYDDKAWVWEASTGKSVAELRGHTGPVFSAVFNPDGSLVVTASFDNTARVWEATTGNSIAELRGHTDQVSSAVFSPDGSLMVTSSRDNTARVWEATTEKSIAELHGHTDQVRRAAFSPDSRFVITSSRDNTARVWEARTGKSVTELRGHMGPVNSASFSPDGRLVVTASYDNTARVWEASTGKSIAGLRGHTGPVVSATFSPDGRLVVTASYDNTARVWEASTGKSIAELRGHTDQVSSATFSSDGKFVVTASGDNSARVWEVSTGKSITELRGHIGQVNTATFSPDGRFVITASGDNTARVWEANTFALPPFATVRAFPIMSDGRVIAQVEPDKTINMTIGERILVGAAVHTNTDRAGLLFTWYTCRTGNEIVVWGSGVHEMPYLAPSVTGPDCIRVKIVKAGALLNDSLIYVNVQE